jgi:hypothetical protein
MIIWKALKRWLLDDRIRISPQVGELLRLRVGQRVIMDDSLWVIAQRCQRSGDLHSGQQNDRDRRVGVRYHLIRYAASRHPEPTDDAPFLGDHQAWVLSAADESSVWMDCYL